MEVGLEASIGKMIGDTFVDRGLSYLDISKRATAKSFTLINATTAQGKNKLCDSFMVSKNRRSVHVIEDH